MLLNDDNESVSIWRTVADHEHDEKKLERKGINTTTKKQIELLYRSNVTTAKRIQHCLREKANRLKPKKLDTDPDVI